MDKEELASPEATEASETSIKKKKKKDICFGIQYHI